MDMILFSMIIGITKDIATVIALLAGIYFGHKGLKKYLLDDIVKKKIIDLHKNNKKVAKVTKEIISDLNSLEDLNRPLKDDDMKLFKSYTNDLLNIYNDASKEVASLCFFLNETIKDIEIFVDTGTYKEIRIAQDVYTLVYHACRKINQISSNIIDLPQKIKLEPYNEINKTIRKYIKNEGIYKVKGIEFGINLNPSIAIH